ncbi:unnamed protein product [Caenorhabditis brenneri]
MPKQTSTALHWTESEDKICQCLNEKGRLTKKPKVKDPAEGSLSAQLPGEDNGSDVEEEEEVNLLFNCLPG